jgi:hypothetical protein
MLVWLQKILVSYIDNFDCILKICLILNLHAHVKFDYYFVVKADRQPDKMLKYYFEQREHSAFLNEYYFIKKMSDIAAHSGLFN